MRSQSTGLVRPYNQVTEHRPPSLRLVRCVQVDGKSPHEGVRLCDIGDTVVETPFNIEDAHNCIEQQFHKIKDAEVDSPPEAIALTSAPARVYGASLLAVPCLLCCC